MAGRSSAVAFVKDVYETLLNEDDLSPANHTVTAALTSFVAFLRASYLEEWASDLPDAPEFIGQATNLPLLCAKAGRAMEKWWCRRFLAEQARSPQALEAFWYFDNYLHLVKGELSLLDLTAYKRVFLLAAGALPLTAFLLAAALPNISLRCVDNDDEACDLSNTLIQNLGLGARIEVVAGRAESAVFEPSDAVFCASLLDAPGLFDVFLRDGVEQFIVRDAVGLFRLCYKTAPIPPALYREMARTEVSALLINISRLFRRNISRQRF